VIQHLAGGYDAAAGKQSKVLESTRRGNTDNRRTDERSRVQAAPDERCRASRGAGTSRAGGGNVEQKRDSYWWLSSPVPTRSKRRGRTIASGRRRGCLLHCMSLFLTLSRRQPALCIEHIRCEPQHLSRTSRSGFLDPNRSASRGTPRRPCRATNTALASRDWSSVAVNRSDIRR
jgi:hypothetical protein